ncbi:MAG: hypothetical protein JKY19_05670 [Alcanivoracaceae bacterium]|nr:hypothetical protein [Alcanivoracaceae bacterium]
MRTFACIVLIWLSQIGITAEKSQSILNEETFKGLKLRNIGPALMSGRIADIAFHPNNKNTWYVGVGSGGVWKTINAGTTWKPVFDKQKVYSIGSVTIDKSNPNIIWVGTGENVGGRHSSFGNGIYRSLDGGENWQNMGLEKSEHISTVIIHPNDSNTLWVSAQGPLWSSGDDRGLYKTSDGGKTWKKVLGDDEWTGVTDLLIDPRNPDRLYAATWQRHRTVAAYMGGGDKTLIYKSEDGGESWLQLKEGLPESTMGKIGLAISPQNPDVIYAAIELERRTGAVYKSTNQGASWTKQSDTVSGATGPHYYQELYASPHAFDRIYLANNRMKVSDDGGKTFRTMKEENKHSDNHALAFRKDDPDYLMVGTDGGLYESFDLAQSWRFVSNLPVTQFYKVAVDNAKPFYHIYGGTQDNNTQGGPSRTDNVHGIRNSDWYVVLFGDGHQPATDPSNPDIVYAEWQQGNLVRVDKTTGEIVYIQPQPKADENKERFNWDAPILVSPHKPSRLYFASHRVWKSEDRGDSWIAISGDLTKNQERITLPIMGKTQSWDSPWDVLAMSNYNTITSLAESPLKEGLIYAGTDDGFIQVTENAGKHWRKIKVASLPGVPKTAFVNDIKADLFDENTVYVALDNHKFGDYQPYLFKSNNRGKSWQSMSGDLPDKHLVWRMVQDHVNKNLMFAATEFGLFFTIDAGDKWLKLTGDVPTISFRDLVIQRTENDLIGASFGRGFFVFDDYSLLREVNGDQLKQTATLFPVKPAWWYIPKIVLGFSEKASQGSEFFTAKNPPFGSVFNYYLKEGLSTAKEKRQEQEKKAIKDKKTIGFPGWNKIEAERLETKPAIWLTVKDHSGNVVRRIEGTTEKGFNQAVWDLRFPASLAIGTKGGFFGEQPKGMMAAPGKYTVTLSQEVNGEFKQLAEPKSFSVNRLRKGVLDGAEPKDTVAFWQQLAKLQRQVTAAQKALSDTLSRAKQLKVALTRSYTEPGKLDRTLHQITRELNDFDVELNGLGSKNQIGEKNHMTISDRISAAMMGTTFSTYGPTPTHKDSLAIATEQFNLLKSKLNDLLENKIPQFEKKLQETGAPWVAGAPLPES